MSSFNNSSSSNNNNNNNTPSNSLGLWFLDVAKSWKKPEVYDEEFPELSQTNQKKKDKKGKSNAKSSRTSSSFSSSSLDLTELGHPTFITPPDMSPITLPAVEGFIDDNLIIGTTAHSNLHEPDYFIDDMPVWNPPFNTTTMPVRSSQQSPRVLYLVEPETSRPHRP